MTHNHNRRPSIADIEFDNELKTIDSTGRHFPPDELVMLEAMNEKICVTERTAYMDFNNMWHNNTSAIANILHMLSTLNVLHKKKCIYKK